MLGCVFFEIIAWRGDPPLSAALAHIIESAALILLLQEFQHLPHLVAFHGAEHGREDGLSAIGVSQVADGGDCLRLGLVGHEVGWLCVL